MHYLAVIGDIVASKHLARRGEFQARLAAQLKAVSTRNAALASPYTITLGDEFQAVYRRADTLFADLVTLMADIHPVQARFAVGVGPLTTAINPKQALGMDGPAFHRAREAIIELKRTGYTLRLQGGPETAPGAVSWKLLNHTLNLATHRIGSWERNRLRVLQGLLAGTGVAELEAELKISRVAVYKNINAAALDELRGLCEEITALLNRQLAAP